MGVALLVCRAVLAGVFMLAGCAKLADLAGSRNAVVAFGVPDRFAGPVSLMVPIAEIAVAVALVPVASAPAAALGAAFLLACFSIGIANALAHGRAPDCHCFGQVHSAPASWHMLGRNLALLAMAAFVAIAGWDGAGVSATHWVTQVSAAWLVAIVATVVIVALVGFQVWFSLQLLAQHGRALGRIDALEGSLGEIRGALGMAEDVHLDSLGEGLAGGGLPVGSPAPEFALTAATGEAHSLSNLLTAGSPVMLVFSAHGCGPCDALMPRLALWQREHVGRLTIAVIAEGDRERNRAEASEHGLTLMLLQSEREVAEAYEAHGTPVAVVIDTTGSIASPAVGGPEAIETLVAQATQPALEILHVPPANGGDNGAASGSPGVSRVGDVAPELVLSDLDGEQVALTELYAQRTVAIFWNPGCGFCQSMLSDLKELETALAPESPQLVVISAGDPEAVRAQALRSPVLIDAGGEAMHAFGAGGTPMAVAVEHGRVASPMAAGAGEVLRLIVS
jgi:thiol-disulfide isomerase/thioredoxin